MLKLWDAKIVVKTFFYMCDVSLLLERYFHPLSNHNFENTSLVHKKYVLTCICVCWAYYIIFSEND